MSEKILTLMAIGVANADSLVQPEVDKQTTPELTLETKLGGYIVLATETTIDDQTQKQPGTDLTSSVT